MSTFSGSDTALAFSWQGVTIPGGGSTVRSILIKFGVFKPDDIGLEMTFPTYLSPLHYQETINITGLATSSNASDYISVLVTLQGDLSRVLKSQQSYPVHQLFTFGFRPADYRLEAGTYNVTFYAVNWEGSVS
jgi:hypothetical protein